MGYLDSSDIARRVKLRLNRATSDEAFTVSATDDALFDFATEAQDEITKRLATFTPDALWTVPTLLTSSDGGATWVFGTDTDGAAIFALGKFSIYNDRQSIPDAPLVPGVDFTLEGTRLRVPNFGTLSFPDGGPYAQYVAPSNVIAAATQPTIPKIARLALVSLTAAKAASRIRDYDVAAEQRQEYENDWLTILSAIRTQAAGKGGAPLNQRPRRWWRG